MNEVKDVTLCPQCCVPLGAEAPLMCTVCGWISIDEIQRQVRYWQRRLLEATKRE